MTESECMIFADKAVSGITANIDRIMRIKTHLFTIYTVKQDEK